MAVFNLGKRFLRAAMTTFIDGFTEDGWEFIDTNTWPNNGIQLFMVSDKSANSDSRSPELFLNQYTRRPHTSSRYLLGTHYELCRSLYQKAQVEEKRKVDFPAHIHRYASWKEWRHKHGVGIPTSARSHFGKPYRRCRSVWLRWPERSGRTSRDVDCQNPRHCAWPNLLSKLMSLIDMYHRSSQKCSTNSHLMYHQVLKLQK